MPVVYTDDQPYWMQGNYAPVMNEIEARDLEIRGALPPELSGYYVKNSSNPPRSDSPHWFFGDGMVYRLSLSPGLHGAAADGFAWRQRRIDSPSARLRAARPDDGPAPTASPATSTRRSTSA